MLKGTINFTDLMMEVWEHNKLESLLISNVIVILPHDFRLQGKELEIVPIPNLDGTQLYDYKVKAHDGIHYFKREWLTNIKEVK